MDLRVPMVKPVLLDGRGETADGLLHQLAVSKICYQYIQVGLIIKTKGAYPGKSTQFITSNSPGHTVKYIIEGKSSCHGMRQCYLSFQVPSIAL
jgi:hypothetical protein